MRFEAQGFENRCKAKNGRGHMEELRGDLGFSRYKNRATLRRELGSWETCSTSVGEGIHKLTNLKSPLQFGVTHIRTCVIHPLLLQLGVNESQRSLVVFPINLNSNPTVGFIPA